MKRVLFLFCALIAQCLTGCEKFISFGFSLPEKYECVYCFIPEKRIKWSNDTTICFTKEDLRLLPLSPWGEGEKYGVVSLGQGTIDYLFYCWESDTVSFFLFDKNVVDTMPWDEIVKNYCVLQRYDFTKEDLNRIRCHIYYPPTEEMATIHMFPPYETFETNRTGVMK